MRLRRRVALVAAGCLSRLWPGHEPIALVTLGLQHPLIIVADRGAQLSSSGMCIALEALAALDDDKLLATGELRTTRAASGKPRGERGTRRSVDRRRDPALR